MTTTGILVIACFIVLGIYDAVVVMRNGVGCSISRFLQRTALRSPVFTFCIGALAGHIFGYMAPEPVKESGKASVMAAAPHDDADHGHAHPRSSEWPRIRAAWLAEHGECEACGGKKDLQVHHVRAFHCDSRLELDPTNFITLCTDGPCNLNCHFVIGHAGNTKTNNPNVRRDAERMRQMLTTGIDCEVVP